MKITTGIGFIAQDEGWDELGDFIVALYLGVALTYIVIILVSVLLWRRSVKKHGKTLRHWKVWLTVVSLPAIIWIFSLIS